jgi:enoyl-CoA hydratase/carnithine racemase
MALVTDKERNIHYIVLNTPYNIISIEFLEQYLELLDQVEKNTEGPGVLVTVSSGQKVFSAGMDLKIF